MPRTKQTAKKTTGAVAVRLELPTAALSLVAPAGLGLDLIIVKDALQSVTLTPGAHTDPIVVDGSNPTQPTSCGTRSCSRKRAAAEVIYVGDDNEEVKTKKTKKGSSSQRAKAGSSSQGGGWVGSSVVVGACVGGDVAGVDKHDNWCAICQNGGMHVACDKCFRVICMECIEFPPLPFPEASKFTCPFCWSYPGGKKSGAKRVVEPYKGLSLHNHVLKVKGVPQTRAILQRNDASPLLVLCMRLDAPGFGLDGLPPMAFYHEVCRYIQVEVVDLPFDLSTNKGVTAYCKRVDDLVIELTAGKYKNYQRFSVFILDHSNPENGDLHITGGDRGAAQVGEVLKLLFPKKLTDALTVGLASNALTLLTCGGVLKHCFSDIKDYINASPFAWCIGFYQMDFQPCLFNGFLSSIGKSWFVHGRAVASSIQHEEAAGVHSDLAVFHKDQPPERYIWAHVGNRPFGTPVDPQCPSCGSLQSWGHPKLEGDVEVNLACLSSKCKYVASFKLPEGYRRLSNKAKTRTGGEWYVHTQ